MAAVKAFKFLNIDGERNLLLCDPNLVGMSELVEIHAPDEVTPRQCCGKILRKVKDPNIFVVHTSYDGHEPPLPYVMGERCILRVVSRNQSGARRRKFTPDEKTIVNLEKNEKFKERKVVRAKTGSVRKRRSK